MGDDFYSFNTKRWYFLCARFGVQRMRWTLWVAARNCMLAFVPVVFVKSSQQVLAFSFLGTGWAMVICYTKPWMRTQLSILDGGVLAAVGLVAGWATVLVPPEMLDATSSLVLDASMVLLCPDAAPTPSSTTLKLPKEHVPKESRRILRGAPGGDCGCPGDPYGYLGTSWGGHLVLRRRHFRFVKTSLSKEHFQNLNFQNLMFELFPLNLSLKTSLSKPGVRSITFKY